METVRAVADTVTDLHDDLDSGGGISGPAARRAITAAATAPRFAGTAITPGLDHCVPGYGNSVRTDQHAAQLRDRADLLDTRARHAPHPIAERLRTDASRLRAYADTHDRTRTTLEGTTR